MSDEKTCRYCSATVPMAAKKCPHCREWLSWKSYIGSTLKLTLRLLFVVFVVAYVASFLITNVPGPIRSSFDVPNSQSLKEYLDSETLNFQGVPPEELQNELEIVSHRMFLTDAVVRIVGTLTNKGQRTWKEIPIKVEFYDKNEKFLDMGTGLVVGPILPKHEEHFEITIFSPGDKHNYDHYKLHIESARPHEG